MWPHLQLSHPCLQARKIKKYETRKLNQYVRDKSTRYLLAKTHFKQSLYA